MEHYANTLGVDEVGRGCLFGDVVAAAVMLPIDLPEDGLWKQIKDSKKLTEKKRKQLRDYIIDNAICYGIGKCTPKEVDDMNILQASICAMSKAILIAYEKNRDIEKVYIDGDRFKSCIILPDDTMLSHECITNGDNKVLNIAAASIVAKCHRDEEILEGCKKNPSWSSYGFETNKGYGTKQHFEALRKHGKLEFHRTSFLRNV